MGKVINPTTKVMVHTKDYAPPNAAALKIIETNEETRKQTRAKHPSFFRLKHIILVTGRLTLKKDFQLLFFFSNIPCPKDVGMYLLNCKRGKKHADRRHRLAYCTSNFVTNSA